MSCYMFSLACLCSMAAAVQLSGLWNSEKTFYKTFGTCCRPRLLSCPETCPIPRSAERPTPSAWAAARTSACWARTAPSTASTSPSASPSATSSPQPSSSPHSPDRDGGAPLSLCHMFSDNNTFHNYRWRHSAKSYYKTGNGVILFCVGCDQLPFRATLLVK